MKGVHIVGIGGATCSGKTMLTQMLKEVIPNAIIINQDDFFLPEGSPMHTIIPELSHANWELPSSLDLQQMMGNIIKVIGEEEVKLGPRLLVIEGIIVLNYLPIANLCDQKIFLTLTKEECWQRRQLRVYDPPDPPNYFDMCIWPMYEKHRDEIKQLYLDHILILDGSHSKEEIFTEVCRVIKTELGN